MTCVITGGTKGIGLAVAEHFAQGGFDLAIAARTAADLENLKNRFRERYPGIRVYVRPTDLSNTNEIAAFAGAVLQNCGDIEVLVNNAGRFVLSEVLTEAEGLLEEMMATNVYSAYHLTRRLISSLEQADKGHIFNICSIASLQAYPNNGAYTITKFALLGFSRSLRLELQERGVRVTAVLPGPTWSDSWAGADLPQDRLMQAADVARAVYGAWEMGPAAVVEEILMRPQLGDF